MRNQISVLLIAALGFATPVFANDTEAVLAKIMNKQFGDGVATMTIKKNGKISGRYKKDKLSGNWTIREGYFCRTVKVGKGRAGTSCQEISMTGNEITFTDVAGANRKPRVYTLK